MHLVEIQILINLVSSIFSSNTPQSVVDDINLVLGIHYHGNLGQYLGLLALWERSKVSTLAFIIDKVRRNMMGWK